MYVLTMVYNPPCHAVYEVVCILLLLLLQEITKSITCTHELIN